MGIDQWLVFGGSWGSTLALAYGQAHPERCTGFVCAVSFLCTRPEIDWFLNGIQLDFSPGNTREFVARYSEAERGDLLQAFGRRLFGDDPQENLQAARAWSRYEGSCLHLLPHPEVADQFGSDAVALGVGRLEAHYFLHRCILDGRPADSQRGAHRAPACGHHSGALRRGVPGAVSLALAPGLARRRVFRWLRMRATRRLSPALPVPWWLPPKDSNRTARCDRPGSARDGGVQTS